MHVFFSCFSYIAMFCSRGFLGVCDYTVNQVSFEPSNCLTTKDLLSVFFTFMIIYVSFFFNQGFLCVCDDGYMVNQDSFECTTELCNDEEDTFCMNHGTCNNEYSNCTCHEQFIDHNCETCKCGYGDFEKCGYSKHVDIWKMVLCGYSMHH